MVVASSLVASQATTSGLSNMQVKTHIYIYIYIDTQQDIHDNNTNNGSNIDDDMV